MKFNTRFKLNRTYFTKMDTVCNYAANTDRLLPRGYQRKRKSSSREKCESKKSKEGEEEMKKLQSLVPSLRDFESGGLSQVDIIEETISYIDQLHKRIAERMVASGNSSQVRTQFYSIYTKFDTI